MRNRRSGPARAIDIITTAAAYVAGAVLVSLMLLTTADVAGRYFFDSPIDGVFDITHFSVAAMVYLGLGYCGFQRGHVVIELLYARLDADLQRWLKRLVNLTGGLLFALIAWRIVVQSIDVRDMREASQLMAIPLFPLYWLVAFGAALFAAVLLLRVFVPEPESEDES